MRSLACVGWVGGVASASEFRRDALCGIEGCWTRVPIIGTRPQINRLHLDIHSLYRIICSRVTDSRTGWSVRGRRSTVCLLNCDAFLKSATLNDTYSLKCIRARTFSSDNPVMRYLLEVTQGLYSLSDKTSYRQISWSLEAARLSVIMIVSLWNLTGISAVLLPRCRSNFRAIEKSKPESRGFETSRDFALSAITTSKHTKQLWILLHVHDFKPVNSSAKYVFARKSYAGV